MLGIDVVSISRIKNVLQRNPEVANKIFTSQERGLSFRQLAGNFAAKEALFKAMQSQSIFNYQSVSVLRDSSGKPQFEFVDDLLKYFSDKPVALSITNDSDLSIAVVLINNN